MSEDENIQKYTPMAFPLMPTQELWERGVAPEYGMELRDWFAGMALATMRMRDYDANAVARDAYAIADSMLKKRGGAR